MASADRLLAIYGEGRVGLNKWRAKIIGQELVDPRDLIGNPKNHRRHPQRQRDVVRDSISELGFIKSILVNKTTGFIIDGHERAHSALNEIDRLERSGEDASHVLVSVEYVELTEAEEAKALAILDASTDLAEVDPIKLDELLREFETGSEALSKMITDLAESAGCLDLGGEVEDVEPEIDRADELQKEWGTAEGQLWIIEGKQSHRLLCGDSTKADDVGRLMGGKKAVLVHADPPYGMGKEKDGVENDNLYRDKLAEFQMAWWSAFRPSIEDNGSAYIWGNSEELWRLWFEGGLRNSERLTFRSQIIWDKPPSASAWGSPIGSDAMRSYPHGYEVCLFFMLGEQGFNNNADNYWEGFEPIRKYLDVERQKVGWTNKSVAAFFGFHPRMADHWFSKSQWSFPTREQYERLQAEGKGDAFKREYDDLKREYDDLKREFYATRAYFDNTHDNMTDVWEFKRVTGEDRHGHATPKPVEMMGRCLKSSCPDGGIVVDPFLGSGTTMLAAEQLNRKCYGVEISPKYVAVILQRMKTAGCECRLSE